MTTTIDEASLGVGDVAELYVRLARRLEQAVRLDVRAPDAVIEDACQFAWCRLVLHRHRVHRETAMGWLARTAMHEALKLLHRDRRELSLEAETESESEEGPLATRAPSAAPPHDLVEARERLAGLRDLPERQRRVLWLHALGLSYEEIARREGCTVRTVDRQLLRARRTARERGA